MTRRDPIGIPSVLALLCATALLAAQERSLPAFLIPVGAGDKPVAVPMGISAAEAQAIAKASHPHNETARRRALRNLRPELGKKTVAVRPFLLARHPVTNEEYMQYVQATNAMFPFHWWRDGATEDFECRQVEFSGHVPDARLAALNYWAKNWRDLPFAIPKGTEKHPVRFVNRADAQRYAAWAGMRLPTEAEWTLAANGGKAREYVFEGEFDEKVLRAAGIDNPMRATLRDVGSMGAAARGPFGHEDMFGQVWELVTTKGYRPQVAHPLFAAEDEALRVAENRTLPAPGFRDDLVIAKGGSYFSIVYQNWLELRINCRARLLQEDTVDGVGFRVARSRRPAYDMSLSRLAVDRPAYLFVKPNLARQVGIERYALDVTGQKIQSYDAVSFVPIDHFDAKDPAGQAILGKSQWFPQPVGVLITTVPLAEPKLEAGTYTVYMREKGVPKELTTALRAGVKVMSVKGRRTSRRNPNWESVIERFGYTSDDMKKAKPRELARRIYLRHTGPGKAERYPVKTKVSVFLFRERTGNWAATVPAKRLCREFRKGWAPSKATVKSSKLSFEFFVPANMENAGKPNGKNWRFRLDLGLDRVWN